MGASSIYLLPEVDVDPVSYGKTVKKVLLQMGAIENENYDEANWWIAGLKSGEMFEEGVADEPGFEYCIITASKHLEVVPQDPAEFPSCPSCGVSVSDQFYDVVNDIEERYEDKPAKKSAALVAAKVACASCKVESGLASLKADVGIFLSGTWINFEDTPGKLRKDWLANFAQATGIPHKCLEYWYT